MADKGTIAVELCMGSSCFARGNNNALAYLEAFIEENGLSDRIDLEGHLCMGACNDGPHINVNGKEYSGITDPDCIIDIIRKALEAQDA